jgi:ATP-dependent Lon protease
VSGIDFEGGDGQEPDVEFEEIAGDEAGPFPVGPSGFPQLDSGARIPQSLPILPLLRAVPFPGIMMPVQLASERARATVQRAGQRYEDYVALVAKKRKKQESVGDPREMLAGGPEDDGGPYLRSDLYSVGVIAKILKLIHLPDGGQAAMLHGVRRFRLGRVVRRKPLLVVKVERFEEQKRQNKRVEAQVRNLQQLSRGIADNSPQFGDEFITAVMNIDGPAQITDFVSAYLVRDLDLRQQILEAANVAKRLDLAVEALTKELSILELGARIQDEIKQKIEKAQKEYFLREQIKIIRRELGEEVDSKQAEIKRLAKLIEEAGLPEKVEAKAREELERLKVTPVESPEHTVTRNHLDWLLSLPWSKSSEDRRDVRMARKVLEEDHHGLGEVKARILEFLAVRKLRDEHAGPILCLSGPPGVGKTSLGRSIARAMGREFWRFSLGGMRDEAEIKGHRRTYVGAMPGRIMQGIAQCASNNPVIMLDEVDKLGSDFRGDPSSALLEVLDPEQNHAFVDHYLDVPFDLSRVFFVATANVLPNIPPALRDRMEVIEIPGYLANEKVEIALRHLLPKQLEAHGLNKSQLSLSRRVLHEIVDSHTREAGVRNLEKAIAKICRKRALVVARGGRKPKPSVSLEELTKMLGQPRFGTEGERRIRVPGVGQGLAWTPVGGELLFIEAQCWPGRGEIHTTGQLGDVMRESVRIALGYLRARADKYGIDAKQLSENDIHVHFPAGAVPKDGPSAGITIATALLSLFRKKSAPRDLAMTGELTLVGEVLPIGGVREKVLAARSQKIKRIVLPSENRPDVSEIESDLVKGMKFHYVDTFDEVAELLGWVV